MLSLEPLHEQDLVLVQTAPAPGDSDNGSDRCSSCCFEAVANQLRYIGPLYCIMFMASGSVRRQVAAVREMQKRKVS